MPVVTRSEILSLDQIPLLVDLDLFASDNLQLNIGEFDLSFPLYTLLQMVSGVHFCTYNNKCKMITICLTPVKQKYVDL